jgi:hypothetical protein
VDWFCAIWLGWYVFSLGRSIYSQAWVRFETLAPDCPVSGITIESWAGAHHRVFSGEDEVLREKLVKKRILLNDGQRRWLAVKGKVLGRKLLRWLGTIVTPDTILRWYRELVAKK